MGAVATLGIAVVGDGVVAVNVVDGEGHLLVDVPAAVVREQVVLHVGVDVQLLQNSLDLLGIQQIQGVDVACGIDALLGGLLLQRVAVCTGVEALVVGVETGIDDGDPGTGTGVTGGPGGARADHAGGRGLQGCGSLTGQGCVLLLDNDLLDADHGSDCIDGAVGDVGGDDVAGQGHVPDHIQLRALQGTLLDGGGDHGLLAAQVLAVGLCGSVGGNALGGELLQGGLVVQDDGNTNHFICFVFILPEGVLHRLQIQLDISVNAVDLLDGECIAGALGPKQVTEAPGVGHGAQAEHHAQHEHQSQCTEHRISLVHFLSSSDHFLAKKVIFLAKSNQLYSVQSVLSIFS